MSACSSRGICGGKFELGKYEETDRESFAMETLYDLLGALPNDDADDLRAAFRHAAKRAHPDLNPGDPDAGLKFRRIVRASEILSDVGQRAAYDRLLEAARVEQERAAMHAAADKAHKLASGVMALAGMSIVAVGGYALFLQLSTNDLTPATSLTEAVREPAVIVATEPTREATAITSAAPPPATSEQADTTAPAIMPPTESTPSDSAETVPSHIASHRFGRAVKHSPKFASNHIDGSIILYGLGKFAGAFAEFPPSKRLRKTSRSTASSASHAANANWRLRRKNPFAARTG
jgi:curved DNA-binding protein CbpA